AVDEAFVTEMKDFVRHAKIAGFRPGKAPEAMVLKQYAKDIEEQVKRKLIVDAYQQGIKEHKLTVIGYPDIEEIQFSRGQPVQFAARIEIQPEFEMPEYRGLPARREPAIVSEQDVTKALEALRGQSATYQVLERPVQPGDFVVVNYTGTCEGQPIVQLAPTARS